MNRPIITFFRGLPGSGKSTAALKLAAETGAMLIEPDRMMVIGGQYHYDPYRYMCADIHCASMIKSAGKAGCDVIYADVLARISEVNTLVAVYLKNSARGCCPDVRVIDMPLLTVEGSIARNRHNVRAEDIAQMAASWEPWGDTNG